MKTIRFIKRASTALVALSMVFIVFGSSASNLNVVLHKRDRTEEFHKTLESKGYTHITEFSVIKSDIHSSKYFVNFVDSGKVYDAYFFFFVELIEVYEVAKM